MLRDLLAALEAMAADPGLRGLILTGAGSVFSAGADYGERAEDEILVFAMIETAEAMQNLDAIAATPPITSTAPVSPIRRMLWPSRSG